MGMENWEAFCKAVLKEKYIEPGSRQQPHRRSKRSREPTPSQTAGGKNEQKTP